MNVYNTQFPDQNLEETRNLLNEETNSEKNSSNDNWQELFPEIIGRSSAIKNVLHLVAKIARSDSSVLILGESGTGKELIASAIHRLSLRNHKTFAAINCSAIPEELLEAELFGHEKGAFTGADRKREGYFGAADGGSIFLDEVGDMTLRLQAKLLRVLQEKKYSTVGSSRVKEVDIRFIAATNKDLETAVKQQTFRLDLYYRLNVLPIHLPRLADRAGDVHLLIEYFLNMIERIHPNSPACWFENDTMEVLARYQWPGNIRQLRNLVERLFILKGGGPITIADLPPEYLVGCEKKHESFQINEANSVYKDLSESNPNFSQLPKEGIELGSFIQNIENSLIEQALSRTNNNKNQAAKLLGLNRTTLVERIKKRKIKSNV